MNTFGRCGALKRDGTNHCRIPVDKNYVEHCPYHGNPNEVNVLTLLSEQVSQHFSTRADIPPSHLARKRKAVENHHSGDEAKETASSKSSSIFVIGAELLAKRLQEEESRKPLSSTSRSLPIARAVSKLSARIDGETKRHRVSENAQSRGDTSNTSTLSRQLTEQYRGKDFKRVGDVLLDRANLFRNAPAASEDPLKGASAKPNPSSTKTRSHLTSRLL